MIDSDRTLLCLLLKEFSNHVCNLLQITFLGRFYTINLYVKRYIQRPQNSFFLLQVPSVRRSGTDPFLFNTLFLLTYLLKYYLINYNIPVLIC